MATPVHLITNDEALYIKFREIGLHYTLGAQDYTEAEGLHYHYFFEWPTNTHTRRLTPSRESAVKRARRHIVINPRTNNIERCICFGRGSNYKCPRCGYYYKFIWLASDEHVHNTKRYIERKIAQNPTVDIAYIEAQPIQSDSDSDSE